MYKTIIICGLDGSGKTTVIKALKNYLSTEKVLIVWFRWRALFSYVLYIYSNIRKLYKWVYNPRVGKSFKVNEWFNDKFLKYFYPYSLIFDMLIFYFMVKIKAIILKPDVLIFDRYFIDAMVDIVYETRNPKILASVLMRLTYALVKKADLCVVFDVNPKVAFKRKKDILSIEELMYKRVIYTNIAKNFRLYVIDTSNYDPKEVLRKIVEFFFSSRAFY
jgi:thymidylate kinase